MVNLGNNSRLLALCNIQITYFPRVLAKLQESSITSYTEVLGGHFRSPGRNRRSYEHVRDSYDLR